MYREIDSCGDPYMPNSHPLHQATLRQPLSTPCKNIGGECLVRMTCEDQLAFFGSEWLGMGSLYKGPMESQHFHAYVRPAIAVVDSSRNVVPARKTCCLCMQTANENTSVTTLVQSNKAHLLELLALGKQFPPRDFRLPIWKGS